MCLFAVMCKFTKKLGLDDTIRFSIVMKRHQTTDSKLEEARQCMGEKGCLHPAVESD
jgi:hypothetical protein